VRLATLLGCLGVFWAIWSVPLVLTNDGPVAVLTAHMESHYDDPGSIFARQFTVGFGLSGRGFSVLYRPIASVLSWPDSLRLSQLVIVLALALAVAWLCRALSGTRPARFSSLVGFVIAFSWPFYMGFFAFSISMAVGLMVLAFVVGKSDGLTRIEKAAVMTALLVQLFMHGFAVFITLGLVGLVVMTRAFMSRGTVEPADWRKAMLAEAGWLALATVPSVVVLLVMRTAQTKLATYVGADKTEWAPAADWAKELPRLAVPGSTFLGTVVLVAALASLVRTALRLRQRPRKPEEVALFIGATGLLLAALVAPLNVPGWQFFSPRFLTTGLAVSLSLLATEKLEQRAPRLAFDLGVVAAVTAALVSARALHDRLATACHDGLVGLEHRITRSGFQLPIVLDANCSLTTDNAAADVPFATPLLHFYSLFAVTHGGSVPYGFFGPAAVHAFVPRTLSPVPAPPVEQYWGLASDDPRLVRPDTRARLVTEEAVYGTYYENVLVFGANARDREVLADRGYVTDFEHGSFVNAHFVACPVEVESEVFPTDPPVLVRGGLRNDELWNAKIAPIPNRHAVRASLKMLCGDVWVRYHWQGSEQQRCKNADAKGRLFVHATRDGAHVVCERDE
jgi:hypothetical protein